MVLLIAIAHCIPVLLVAVLTNSRTTTTGVAVISAAAGALTGNPIYIALDVSAVAVAWWFCFQAITPSERKGKTARVVSGFIEDVMSLVVGFGTLAAIFFGGLWIYNTFFGVCSNTNLDRLKITDEECQVQFQGKKPQN